MTRVNRSSGESLMFMAQWKGWVIQCCCYGWQWYY